MKKCYFCAEEIQDDAKKCRFCNEWIKEESEDEKDRKAFLKLYRTNLDNSDEANRILKRIRRRSLLKMYAYSIISIAVALIFFYWLYEELKIDKLLEIVFIASTVGIPLTHIIQYKRGKSAVKRLAKSYASRILEEKRQKAMELEKGKVLSLIEETHGEAGVLETDAYEIAVEKAYKWEQNQKKR